MIGEAFLIKPAIYEPVDELRAAALFAECDSGIDTNEANETSERDRIESLRAMINENDAVNHPSHYTSHPSGVECITVTEHFSFCLGNAVKYIWRSGLKGDSHIEDLQKARFYIDREIKRLGGE